MGSFPDNELPLIRNRYSGLMVKLKPDSSARMILNLSKGDPISVNAGIDSDKFPTKMSTTLSPQQKWEKGRSDKSGLGLSLQTD